MELTFRWYGEGDPVTLAQIRQIPLMTGIVSSLYEIPAGELWPIERLQALRARAEKNGLSFEVAESLPVHEEIKWGGPGAGLYLKNYCENLRRLAKCGVRVVCYNFMPVFDWLRSDLKNRLPDGSYALSFDREALSRLPVGSLSLPGWDQKDGELSKQLSLWGRLGPEDLWRSLERFLHTVIPVAEEVGIRMAIHPDDPPWDVFGIPRIITGRESFQRMLEIEKSPANGIALCTGSLGENPKNDLVELSEALAPNIPFAHLRNVQITGPESFTETAHPSACGSLDLYAIVKALVRGGFNGYVRPDHGRMIWGEEGRPGYGLYDRALGAAYLTGLFEAAEKEKEIWKRQ